MWVVVIIYCYLIYYSKTYQFKTIYIYYLIVSVGRESLCSLAK